MWKRIVTAAVLAPLFLLALISLPAAGVQVLIGLILVGVVWEAAQLSGFQARTSQYLFVFILIIIGLALPTVAPVGKIPKLYLYSAGIACLWWLLDIFILAQFRMENPKLYGSKTGRILSISVVMLSAWMAINALLLQDSHSPRLLVYVLVMVWVADSGAYFTGKFLGSHKLASHVSPGKTIEGVIGGVFAVMIFAWLYGSQVFHFNGMDMLSWQVLSVVVGLLSVVGDLNESALKRVMGKKDSGNIFPGHGGFFDRADAITAAVPVFYFGWRIMGIGNVS